MDKKKLTSEVKKTKDKAKKVLRNYLFAWKKQDWERMLENSTKTFKANNKGSYFYDWLCQTKVISFKIIEIKYNDRIPALCDVVIQVKIRVAQKTEIREVQIRMVKEKSAYTASVNGSWGVNPPSTLKILRPDVKVITEGDNSENKTE